MQNSTPQKQKSLLSFFSNKRNDLPTISTDMQLSSSIHHGSSDALSSIKIQWQKQEENLSSLRSQEIIQEEEEREKKQQRESTQIDMKAQENIHIAECNRQVTPIAQQFHDLKMKNNSKDSNDFIQSFRNTMNKKENLKDDRASSPISQKSPLSFRKNQKESILSTGLLSKEKEKFVSSSDEDDVYMMTPTVNYSYIIFSR